MRISSLILAIVAAAAVTPHTAEASAPTIGFRLWASIGNGCTVADESAGLYDSRGAGIGFLPGKIGTIRLFCPISVPTSITANFTGIGLSYNHPTASGGSASITATFRKIGDGSNAASTICTATSSATGIDQTFCSVTSFAQSKTTSYYVEVDVVRTSTAVDPEFLAVFLFT